MYLRNEENEVKSFSYKLSFNKNSKIKLKRSKKFSIDPNKINSSKQ